MAYTRKLTKHWHDKTLNAKFQEFRTDLVQSARNNLFQFERSVFLGWNRKRKCMRLDIQLTLSAVSWKFFLKCIDSKFDLITNSFMYFFSGYARFTKPTKSNCRIFPAEFHISRDLQGHIHMTLIIIVDLDRSKSE